MRRLTCAVGASFSLHALAWLALPWQVPSRTPPSENRSAVARSMEVRLSSRAGAEGGFVPSRSLPLPRGDDQPTATAPSFEPAPLLTPMLVDAEAAEIAVEPLELALPQLSGPDIARARVASAYSDASEAMRRQMEMQARMQRIQGLWMTLSQQISMSPVQTQGDCEFRQQENFEPRCSSSALKQWADETSVRSLCVTLTAEGANFTVLRISSFDGQVSVQIR